ncbi:MAG: AraC family transcriptional regulator [Ruminococcus sp.]|nr:AraC family transcriptional regulator [Ruminococcus sp.]
MFFCDFPIIGEESSLPLYLVNMGKHICQPKTTRGEGFPYPQILYCTKGRGVIKAEGRVSEIGAGNAIIIPANLPHEYYPTDNEWDIHWVVPAGSACDELLVYLKLDSLCIFELTDTALLEHFFSMMHRSLRDDRISGNFRASGYLYNFLIELSRQKNFKSRVMTSNHAILSAVDYIDNNYTQPITMDELCQAAGLSKQQLCRLFKRYLHSRPMEYAAKRRIQAAKELLLSTELSIEDIAERVGFCSGSYFSKLFCRYEGMTPSHFRHIK